MELFFQPFLTPKITISPIKSILLLKTRLFKLLLEYQDRDFRAIFFGLFAPILTWFSCLKKLCQPKSKKFFKNLNFFKSQKICSISNIYFYASSKKRCSDELHLFLCLYKIFVPAWNFLDLYKKFLLACVSKSVEQWRAKNVKCF